jgi:hypothetical protein
LGVCYHLKNEVLVVLHALNDIKECSWKGELRSSDQ